MDACVAGNGWSCKRPSEMYIAAIRCILEIAMPEQEHRARLAVPHFPLLHPVPRSHLYDAYGAQTEADYKQVRKLPTRHGVQWSCALDRHDGSASPSALSSNRASGAALEGVGMRLVVLRTVAKRV